MYNLIRISFLLLLTSAIALAETDLDKFKKAPDPNCPLTYFYRGYDWVKGNPVSNDGDTGWRSRVFKEGIDSYVQKAVHFAEHPDALANLKKQPKTNKTKLYNTAQFTQDLEVQLQNAWQYFMQDEV